MLHVFCWQCQVNCFHPERALFHLCCGWASEALVKNWGLSCKRCTDMHVNIVSSAKSMLSDVIIQKCYRKESIALRIAWRLQFPHMWADYSVTAVLWGFFCAAEIPDSKQFTESSQLVVELFFLLQLREFMSNCFFFLSRKVGKIKWKLSGPLSRAAQDQTWGGWNKQNPTLSFGVVTTFRWEKLLWDGTSQVCSWFLEISGSESLIDLAIQVRKKAL